VVERFIGTLKRECTHQDTIAIAPTAIMTTMVATKGESR
jgi:hypothetical protein